MSSEVEIQLQEGESLADAVKRLAKEQAANGESCSQSPTSAKPAKSKKVTVTDPSAGQAQPGEESVYAALHIYQRPDEPEGAVRVNGSRERRMHGPNTLVFVHMHQFGAECTSACKERV